MRNTITVWFRVTMMKALNISNGRRIEVRNNIRIAEYVDVELQSPNVYLCGLWSKRIRTNIPDIHTITVIHIPTSLN